MVLSTTQLKLVLYSDVKELLVYLSLLMDKEIKSISLNGLMELKDLLNTPQLMLSLMMMLLLPFTSWLEEINISYISTNTSLPDG